MAPEAIVVADREATEVILATDVLIVGIEGIVMAAAASISVVCTMTTVTDLANAVGSTVVPCALAARTGGIVSKTASTKQS